MPSNDTNTPSEHIMNPVPPQGPPPLPPPATPTPLPNPSGANFIKPTPDYRYPFEDNRAQFDAFYRAVCQKKKIQADLSHLTFVDGRPLDLYLFHKHLSIVRREPSMTLDKLWSEVATRMGLIFSCTSASPHHNQHSDHGPLPESASPSLSASPNPLLTISTSASTPDSDPMCISQHLSRIYNLYLSFFDTAIEENIAANKLRVELAKQTQSALNAAGTHPFIPQGMAVTPFLINVVGLQPSRVEPLSIEQRVALVDWTRSSEAELRIILAPSSEEMFNMVMQVKKKLTELGVTPEKIAGFSMTYPSPLTGNIIEADPKTGSKKTYDLLHKLSSESQVTNLPTVDIPPEHRQPHEALFRNLHRTYLSFDHKFPMLHEVIQQENFIKHLFMIARHLGYQDALLNKPDSEKRFVLTFDALKRMAGETQHLLEHYNQKLNAKGFSRWGAPFDAPLTSGVKPPPPLPPPPTTSSTATTQRTYKALGPPPSVPPPPIPTSSSTIVTQPTAIEPLLLPSKPSLSSPSSAIVQSRSSSVRYPTRRSAESIDLELLRFHENYKLDGPEEIIRWISNRCKPLKSVYEEFLEQRKVLVERLSERESKDEEQELERESQRLAFEEHMREHHTNHHYHHEHQHRNAMKAKGAQAASKPRSGSGGAGVPGGLVGLPFTEEEHARAIHFVNATTQAFATLPATIELLRTTMRLPKEHQKEYHKLHDHAYQQYQEYGRQTALLHLLMGKDSKTKHFIVIGYILSYQQHVFAAGEERYVLTLDQMKEWADDYEMLIEEFLERKNALHREQMEAHMRSLGQEVDLSGIDANCGLTGSRKNKSKSNKKKKKKNTEFQQQSELEEEENFVTMLTDVLDFLEMYKARTQAPA